MVKRTFRVVFSVQPAVRVTNPITLNPGKVTLILEDIWDEIIQAPVGPRIKGTVETETMDLRWFIECCTERG